MNWSVEEDKTLKPSEKPSFVSMLRVQFDPESRSRTSSFNSAISESERRDAFSSDDEIGSVETAALMESRKQLRLGSVNSLQRSLRHVINYNVLVVGESRLGKSTIIEQLLQSERTAPRSKYAPLDNASSPVNEAFTCRSESSVRTMMLKHKRSKLVVSLIETPGFGPRSMGSDCWEPVFDEIEGRLSKYMEEENNINRRVVVDHRIHCCIYFLSPFASGLRPVDLDFMGRACRLVNIIPVIAKVDTLTTKECKKLKGKVLEDCVENEISLFHPEMFDLVDYIAPPYTVIGGENTDSDIKVTTSDGEATPPVVGRQYPWGFAEVTNEEHCDYVTLYDIILRSCIEDFIEYTDSVLYESYRMNHLRALDVNSAIELIDPLNKNPSPSPGDLVEEVLTEKERLLREKQFELDKLKRQVEQISQRMSERVPTNEVINEEEEKEEENNQDISQIRDVREENEGEKIGEGKEDDEQKEVYCLDIVNPTSIPDSVEYDSARNDSNEMGKQSKAKDEGKKGIYKGFRRKEKISDEEKTQTGSRSQEEIQGFQSEERKKKAYRSWRWKRKDDSKSKDEKKKGSGRDEEKKKGSSNGNDKMKKSEEMKGSGNEEEEVKRVEDKKIGSSQERRSTEEEFYEDVFHMPESSL